MYLLSNSVYYYKNENLSIISSKGKQQVCYSASIKYLSNIYQHNVIAFNPCLMHTHTRQLHVRNRTVTQWASVNINHISFCSHMMSTNGTDPRIGQIH